MLVLFHMAIPSSSECFPTDDLANLQGYQHDTTITVREHIRILSTVLYNMPGWLDVLDTLKSLPILQRWQI